MAGVEPERDGMPPAEQESRGQSKEGEFDVFLKGLLVETNKRLESMPEAVPSKDPLLLARERREEEGRARQAAAQARLAVIDQKKSQEIQKEADWREQVRQTKEAERKRLAQEAADAAAAEAQALAGALVDKSPIAVARSMWSADDLAREKAREEAAAALQKEEQAWLDQEWLPRLNRRKEELREYREAAARREQEAREALVAAERREAEAMAREDSQSTRFLADLDAECKRRETIETSATDTALEAAMKAIVARKLQEQQWALQREEAQRQAEEEERRQEIARKDREYIEWKQQVHAERCRRRRLEEREAPVKDEDEKRRLELQGRDFFREREVQHMAVLEDALKRANESSKRIQESGLSPKDVLENARVLAARQCEETILKASDPVRIEGEMWDSLLAKNRLARQQERSNRTPRWGF